MVNFAYGDKYAPFLHDAVLLYAIALNEAMVKGLDYRSGIVVASQMSNKLYSGLSCKDKDVKSLHCGPIKMSPLFTAQCT